jgi:hypothetical protein
MLLQVILAIVIVMAWLGISGWLARWYMRFVRYYDGPEYIGAGSGTPLAFVIAIIGLLGWGAYALISSLLS